MTKEKYSDPIKRKKMQLQLFEPQKTSYPSKRDMANVLPSTKVLREAHIPLIYAFLRAKYTKFQSFLFCVQLALKKNLNQRYPGGMEVGIYREDEVEWVTPTHAKHFYVYILEINEGRGGIRRVSASSLRGTSETKRNKKGAL